MQNHSHPLPQPLPSVAFSSRRRRTTRRPAAGQTRLPDWVWGAGLGAIIVLFVGGYFAVSAATGGGGGSMCDEPLAPIGTSDISAAGFAEEDAGLSQMISMLQRGDRAGFEATFYQGPTHAFTHNVDPPLREEDEEAAKQLCEDVLFVEEGVSLRTPTDEMIAAMLRIQEILRDAAELLGYPRPGEA